MYYILQFFISAGVIYFLSQSDLVPGIIISNGYQSALVFAVILGLVNLFLGTILRIISFPIRLITLGAFSFIISLIVVKVADEFVPGVTLEGFVPLLAIAFASSMTSFIMKIFK